MLHNLNPQRSTYLALGYSFWVGICWWGENYTAWLTEYRITAITVVHTRRTIISIFVEIFITAKQRRTAHLEIVRVECTTKRRVRSTLIGPSTKCQADRIISGSPRWNKRYALTVSTIIILIADFSRICWDTESIYTL